MINFKPYIDKFKEDMELRHYAFRTVDEHLKRLDKFILFLKNYPLEHIEDISDEHIREYQKYRYHYQNVYGRHDIVEVQNRHLITVKAFFKYLKRDDFIIHDPAESICYGKRPTRLPKDVLTNQEMKKLLAQADTRTILGYRDRTILEVLYSTGIRRMELILLNLEDINCQEGCIRINEGKGAKDRIVPIGKIAAHYLDTYLKGIRPLIYNSSHQTAVFLSKQGGRISKETLRYMIEKYAKKSKLNKYITTHTFRRSCATEMIKNKANLMHVKELLGHNSVESVQIYCNLSITDLKEAHKKHHPREKEEK